MRDNGQLAVTTLLQQTVEGLCAPKVMTIGRPVLQGIVPAKFLHRMKRGQWKRCVVLMTCSDLCPALVAGFELGDVQLRLALPLLGAELRQSLESMSNGEPLRLTMVSDDESQQVNLKVQMGPGSAKALAAKVADEVENAPSTLSLLVELTQDVACLTMGHLSGRKWPPLRPDVVVVTMLPPSLVRTTAELLGRRQAMTH